MDDLRSYVHNSRVPKQDWKKLKKIMPSLGKSNMTSVYTVRHDESFFSDFLSFLNPNLSHRRNKYRSGQLIKEIKLNHKQWYRSNIAYMLRGGEIGFDSSCISGSLFVPQRFTPHSHQRKLEE